MVNQACDCMDTVSNHKRCWKILVNYNASFIGTHPLLRKPCWPVCSHNSTSLDSHCFGQSRWRHEMETFSALLAICAGNSPVPGEFPSQRPVTRSFDVFFDLRLNKRLSKQWWGWWFETPSCPLWRHRNGKQCTLPVYGCGCTDNGIPSPMLLLSLLSYVHRYYYFYKLYIVCIMNCKRLIYIDMALAHRQRWYYILEGSPICSMIGNVVVYPLRGTQLGTEIWRLTSWIGGW